MLRDDERTSRRRVRTGSEERRRAKRGPKKMNIKRVDLVYVTSMSSRPFPRLKPAVYNNKWKTRRINTKEEVCTAKMLCA